LPTTLFLLATIFAVLNWIAVLKGLKALEYIAKPGVMLALLAWLWTVSSFQGGIFWFGLGLFFSLFGDIFLMLPSDQFIPGLISFLLAHVAYAIGFTRTLPPANLASLALALGVTAAAGFVYRRVSSGLTDSGNARLKTPVFVYTNVISLMLLTALLTLLRAEWRPEPALLASLGALLFFISDGILAWNKFVAPLQFGRLAVIVSYHLGQILITLGAAQHFMHA
jgi:uncharacterized membrane protein YhhN